MEELGGGFGALNSNKFLKQVKQPNISRIGMNSRVTHPYNAPVTKSKKGAFQQQNIDNLGYKNQENLENVTHPYNESVHTAKNKDLGQFSPQQKISNFRVRTHPYNAPVTKPKKVAGFGNLICENCEKEVIRITRNQRFCCTVCRLKFHRFTPMKKRIY